MQYSNILRKECDRTRVKIQCFIAGIDDDVHYFFGDISLFEGHHYSMNMNCL